MFLFMLQKSGIYFYYFKYIAILSSKEIIWTERVVSHNIKNHVNVEHDILINRFNDYFGDKKVVNSFHQHAIKPDDIASEMKCFAISKDRCIEGIYNIKKSIFGIQWHPERTSFDLGVASFISDIMKKKIN